MVKVATEQSKSSLCCVTCENVVLSTVNQIQSRTVDDDHMLTRFFSQSDVVKRVPRAVFRQAQVVTWLLTGIIIAYVIDTSSILEYACPFTRFHMTLS